MRWALVVVLACSLGCGNSQSPSGPTAPPTASVMLNGGVIDTALRALGGARVEVLDGANAGLSTTTDDSGRFAMPGKYFATFNLRATKDGYLPETKTVQGNAIAGTPSFVSFVLQSPAPPIDVTGTFTLTLVADAACAAEIPQAARTRVYTARISRSAATDLPAGPLFQGTVSGGSFEPGLNAFSAYVSGKFVSFRFTQLDFDVPGIVEQLSQTTALTISGQADDSVTGPTVSMITAPLNGGFVYCRDVPAASGPYRAGQCLESDRVVCQSHNHQLLLSRR